MRKLDRFILKSFIGPFVAILLVVIFVLMMQFLWLYIDELVGKGLGLKVILEFLMWGICTILPMAIPLATLLASMMTVGQLAENNELMAIKAAGISFGRVMAPLTAASVVICLGTFWAGDSLVPKAYNEIFTLRDDISKTKEQIKIPSGTFYDGIDGYILRVEEQQENGLMKGVMVYNHSSNKGNDDVTLADSAYMRLSKNKDFLIFTMYNGTNYREENKKSYRDTVLKLDRIDFQRQEITIPLSNYTFEKSDTSRFGDQRKTMNLKQLIVEHDTLKVKLAQSHAANVNSMLGTSSLYRSSQLDTSFNAAGMRNFSDAKFMEWNSYQDKARAYMTAYDQSQRYLT
ncbi:MAG: LptF/LptG family permease, partial [Bacteroidales bacterium]|nr:LptF/LptG family permease [Candidatus Cryptobacteroides equifaecalis]